MNEENSAAFNAALLVLLGAMLETYGQRAEVLALFSRRFSKLIEQTEDAELSAALTTVESALRARLLR